MTTQTGLPEGMTRSDLIEYLCRHDPAIWSEEKLGMVNGPAQREWYRLIQDHQRLCCLAPRDHGKSQIFTVNYTSWESIYTPGLWTQVFCAVSEQAEAMKTRITETVKAVRPDLVEGARVDNVKEIVFANGARVTVAGAGKAVRGGHPDRIVGDDVLEEKYTHTAHQRRKTQRWWFGTVAGMAHSGTVKVIDGRKVWFGPSRIRLVGTPFHGSDLLMSTKENEMYRYFRYAAEYDPRTLPVPGSLAVEVA